MKTTKYIKSIALMMVVIMLLTTLGACSEELTDHSSAESASSQVELSTDTCESNTESAESSAESSLPEDSSVPSNESSEETSGESSLPDEPTPPDNPVEELDGFRLSSIDDVTGEDGKRVYTVHAPYTDTYSLVGDRVKEITLLQDGDEVASGTEISVSLEQYAVYTLEVETENGNADFKITTKAENHLVTLPYDVPERNEPIEYDVYGNDKLTAAEVNYIKRKGGTYIYSNNPEQFGAQHVGKAFMRNEGLTGEVYVTFEHANYSGNTYTWGIS